MKHTVVAEQIKVGDHIAVGSVGDRIIEQSFTDQTVLEQAAWLLVDSVAVVDDGYTDIMVELPNGVPVEFDIPSAERVALKRGGTKK